MSKTGVSNWWLPRPRPAQEDNNYQKKLERDLSCQNNGYLFQLQDVFIINCLAGLLCSLLTSCVSVIVSQLPTVHKLLAADPSLVHCCDEDGYTPLHRASYSGHVDVVSALLSTGSRVNPRTIDGWTPLHSACRWSRITVVSLLLQHGAELNAQTNGGLTPLHLAASHASSVKTDSANTLELLLSQRHLKPGLRSSSGETASEVARRSGPHHFLFEMVEDCVNVVPMS